ncbi:MAG TPA: hypothetical protein VFI52_17065 [Gemmatimonadaceae bacterium]|nr:hypothetical protein [Gemmatimonadaceae bacterium]
MALRAWRQLPRRRSNIRGIHRLVLMSETTSAFDAGEQREESVLDGELPTMPFSPETTRRLWVALTRISLRTDSSVAVSAVLRTACDESRDVSPDRVVLALHAIWHRIRPAPGRCPEAVQNRYRAVVAELLSLRFGEELVGLP